MKPITMEKVLIWDALFGDRVGEFLQDVRLPTLFHEDNVLKLTELAKKLGIRSDEFFSYVWLRAYLSELRESYGEIASLESVAQQLGIDYDRLRAYAFQCDSRARAGTLDFQYQLESWGDVILEDLQEDAEYPGDLP